MRSVNYSDIKITNGFWHNKQNMVRNTTVMAVYNRFKETGRIDAFKCDKSSTIKPHFFWDSDVAKWIEGVAYLTKEKPEPELEKIVDQIVDDIEKNQDETGYFNIYHTVVEPDKRFQRRDFHELYCLGHLIEASVAYYEATGKDKLLKLVCKYTDYVERVFKIQHSAQFITPGHEEIELALVKLYECTNEKRYLELAKFFIDERGQRFEETTDWTESTHAQWHKPVREQYTAEGHAVRAVYLYSAMADLALKYNDEDLKNACKRLFDNITKKRMYITGGIGSSCEGEAFTIDYDLPNLMSYTETCASIGLVFFAQRMLLLENDSKYSDIIEKVLYNGFLSSISLDGKSFFYRNPLEILPSKLICNVSTKNKNPFNLPTPTRQEVFECSCCPPNIVRFIPSLSSLIYTYDDDTIYVHQFMESSGTIKIGNIEYIIEQKTTYPRDGKIDITVRGGSIKLAIRVPEWCNSYKGNTINGYAYFEINDTVSTISLDFDMKPRFVFANPEVLNNIGKCALSLGPVIYCMEGHDNPCHLREIYLDLDGKFEIIEDGEYGVPRILLSAFRRKCDDSLYSYNKGTFEEIKATLIPYFAFANRGDSEMQVWSFFKD